MQLYCDIFTHGLSFALDLPTGRGMDKTFKWEERLAAL